MQQLFKINVSAVLIAVLPKTDVSIFRYPARCDHQGRDQCDPRDHKCCSGGRGQMSCGGRGLTGFSYPPVVHPTRPSAAL